MRYGAENAINDWIAIKEKLKKNPWIVQVIRSKGKPAGELDEEKFAIVLNRSTGNYIETFIHECFHIVNSNMPEAMVERKTKLFFKFAPIAALEELFMYIGLLTRRGVRSEKKRGSFYIGRQTN